jgi:peroxiredoxin
MSNPDTIPSVGEEAPDFRLPSLAHGEVAPADYRGRQKVVIAFYSTDNTSG